MFSYVLATSAGKRLFGYRSVIYASVALTVLSFSVWLHHFFTMGAGPDVNLFFSTATMLVGIPTGVKVFNWAFTLYRGRLTFDTPMLWAIGGLFLLLVGGLTGMMLAIPAINYTVHNSVFVIAHFHCMVLLVAFSIFAAVAYWFPKVFGFKLDEQSGKLFFATFSLGTFLVFAAMFGLGFEGETRRLDYLFDPHWMPLLIIEEVGIFLYCVSCYYFAKMIYVGIRDRAKHTVGADPWGTSRSLEWLTPSPVPFYNFAVTPQVHALDELAWRRERGLHERGPDHYEPIHMPKNTPIPLFIGALALGFGFGLTWRIWWMAAISLLLIFALVIWRSFVRDIGYEISAEEVEAMEKRPAPVSILTDSETEAAAAAKEVEAH